MKKLLFAVSALAALSLIAPSTGFAQATNTLGIYVDEAGTLNSGDVTNFVPVDIYMVLHGPMTPGMTAVNNIGGVEFKITAVGATVLTFTYPVNVVDISDALGNHAAGFGEALPVGANGATVVCTLNVLPTNATGAAVFTLAPNDLASIPGAMAYLDWDVTSDNIYACLPPYESFDYDVCVLNGTVATEETTMDGIKALYR